MVLDFLYNYRIGYFKRTSVTRRDYEAFGALVFHMSAKKYARGICVVQVGARCTGHLR